MSRWYIDTDELTRYGKRGDLVYWEDILNAPSIDIVRCGECKWRKAKMMPKSVKCLFSGKDDDFCSYGEREGE